MDESYSGIRRRLQARPVLGNPQSWLY